jgi:diacylglycerol O-acyltransferase
VLFRSGAPSGAKINDVLVAGMTGALRAYLKRRGVDVNRMTLRAMVPVDLRPSERALELGNEFGLVVLELAIRSKDPLARLRLTKSHMDSLKRSPEAVAIMALFNVFGRGPKRIEDLAVNLFGSKASVVMTNVVGPQQKIYVAGVPVERIMFWVPHPGRQLGMGISILSYDGLATLAVIADAHLVPDPEAITDDFNREFEGMLKAAKRGEANAAPARTARRHRKKGVREPTRR